MTPTTNISNLATHVVDTSNKLSDRITDLYTKDITFHENVTVEGNFITNGKIKTSGKIDICRYPLNDDDLTQEQRYPPRDLTSLNDTIIGEAYGNGLYKVSRTDVDIAFWTGGPFTDAHIYGAFTDGDEYYDLANTVDYNAVTGYYEGTEYIVYQPVDGYRGEWIKIELPVMIQMTKYGFEKRPGDFSSAPLQYKIYASNDDISWTEIVHKTSDITYVDNVYEESISVNGRFKYYAVVVNKTSSNTLVFQRWNIYGQELNRKFSVDTLDGSGYFAGGLRVYDGLTTTGTTNLKLLRVNNLDKYPPVNLNATGTESKTGATFLISEQAYGNGYYTISWSSHISNNGATLLFNDYWANSYWMSAENTFDRYTGDPTMNASYIGTDTDNRGEWIKIELPEKIYLTQVFLFRKVNDARHKPYPYEYIIYGEKDDGTWDNIYKETNVSFDDVYKSNSHKSKYINTTIPYKKYALLFTKNGGYVTIMMGTVELYGTRILTDTVNIVGNLTTNGNITTSGNINGASPTEISQLSGIGLNTIKDQLDAKQGTLSSSTDVTVKDLTVSGDLTVNGTTVTINTDAYSTEILQIANDSENTIPLLKIDDNSSSSVRNIIQLNKNNDNVFSIDNSGKLLAGGGKFTSSLVYEKDAPYFYIKDTATSGGTASQAALHVNTENFYILGPGSAICQTTNLINKYTSFGSNVTVGGTLSVPWKPNDGTQTGIRLYGDSSDWGNLCCNWYKRNKYGWKSNM